MDGVVCSGEDGWLLGCVPPHVDRLKLGCSLFVFIAVISRDLDDLAHFTCSRANKVIMIGCRWLSQILGVPAAAILLGKRIRFGSM
jgi:hypothetical protein